MLQGFQMTEAELRSTFVSLVAWVFIVLAGLMTLIGAIQNLMLHWLWPGLAIATPDALPMLGWATGHLGLVLGGFLALALGQLIAAIGLLRRRDWARRLFIALLGLGIVWNLAGLALMIAVTATAEPAGSGTTALSWTVVGVNLALGLGIIVLLGWLIRRLRSPRIRMEFGSPLPDPHSDWQGRTDQDRM